MSDAAALSFLGNIVWGIIEFIVAVWVLVTLGGIAKATRNIEAHLRKLAARPEVEEKAA